MDQAIAPLSSETGGRKKSPFTKLKLLIPLLLLIGAGGGFKIYQGLSKDEGLHLSGRIEADETDIGAKYSGRILEMTVQEGDRVKKGQLLVTLEDEELRSQIDGAKARVISSKQQLEQARLQLDVIQSQINEAQLNVNQSEGDTAGRVEQAQATVAAAEFQLAQSQAQVQEISATLSLAKLDRDRFQQLFNEGVVSRQQFDQKQTQWETAQATLQSRQATVNAARKQVNAAKGALSQAKTTSFNPDIQIAKRDRLGKQLEQAQAQLMANQATITDAQAKVAELTAKQDNLKIFSPMEGIVLTRSAEPGEIIATGKTLLTLVNLDNVYLRGYIPEDQVGKIQVGQAAKIFLDSDPKNPLDGTVRAIDTEASFTPENIYFKEDRVTQVFGLKLAIANPEGLAKPGMPADGEILTDDQQ